MSSKKEQLSLSQTWELLAFSSSTEGDLGVNNDGIIIQIVNDLVSAKILEKKLIAEQIHHTLKLVREKEEIEQNTQIYCAKQFERLLQYGSPSNNSFNEKKKTKSNEKAEEKCQQETQKLLANKFDSSNLQNKIDSFKKNAKDILHGNPQISQQTIDELVDNYLQTFFDRTSNLIQTNTTKSNFNSILNELGFEETYGESVVPEFESMLIKIHSHRCGESFSDSAEAEIYKETFHWHSGRSLADPLLYIEKNTKRDTGFYTKLFVSLNARPFYIEIALFFQTLYTELRILKNEKNENVQDCTATIEQFRKKLTDNPNKDCLLKILTISKKISYSTKINLLVQGLFNLLKKENDKLEIILILRDIWMNFREFLNSDQLEIFSLYVPKDIDFSSVFNDLSLQFDSDCVSFKNYQLQHLSDHIYRECNAIRLHNDENIDFIPDLWQIELINAIKEFKNVLVVAPTSAGKSFSALYAISLCLNPEFSLLNVPNIHKCTCVIVAPTKPLCIQTATMARYKYRNTGIKIGVCTSDYREYEFECQVLVIQPEMLEILLLSPANQNWKKNLKYVIFDEVHMIATNDKRKRAIYSRILSLISCPFLALSATIKFPELFQQWLHYIHEKEVLAIPNFTNPPIRWNDLKFYNFSRKNNEISRLHPISLLHSHSDSCSLLQDLTASECYELESAMSKICEKIDFPSINLNDFVFQKDIKQYSEELLKNFYSRSLEDRKQIANLLRNQNSYPQEELQPDQDNTDYLIDLFENILNKSEPGQNDLFPMVCFSRKNEIDNLFKQIIKKIAPNGITFKEDVKVKENRTKQKSTRKISSSADLSLSVEFDDGNPEKKFAGQNLRNSAEKARKEQIDKNTDSILLTFNNYKGKTFYRSEKEKSDSNELRYWIHRYITKYPTQKKSNFMIGLCLGIGIYHEDCPKAYKDIIEFLLREGSIPVVISSGVLGYGVNYACKSVALLSNLLHLNTTSFYQFSGRAGRRGFHLSGNVIFCNFDEDRIRNLIFDSEGYNNFTTVPLINLDTSLRICILLNEAEDKEEAIHSVKKLFCLPLEDSNLHSRYDVKNVQRFNACLQFLYKLNLIDRNAVPIRLAGFTSHLLNLSKRVNYLLAYFINKRCFIPFCEPLIQDCFFNCTIENSTEVTKIIEQVHISLLNELAHFIHPKTNETCKRKHLQPLTEASRNAFECFATDVEDVTNYCKEIGISSDILEENFLLPNIDELRPYPSHDLNSYIIDFYTHCDLSRLEKENGITENHAYTLIKNWNSTLRKMDTALSLLAHEDELLVVLFSSLAKTFERKFEKGY